MSDATIVLRHPAPPAKPKPPAYVRSTLLCSGLAVLRERGRYEEYLGKLEPEPREKITGMIAGVWMPMEVGMAHFAAMDALGMSDEEAFEVGAGSGKRVHATLLQTLVRLARGAGASPWTVFDNYVRLWSRVLDGGGIVISKMGPKDAAVELTEVPPARYAYFRNAFRGVNHVGLSLFASRVYVRELGIRRVNDAFALRVSWA